MGVNSLPNTVTRERRGCDLNPDRSAPESSTLTTRLPCHHIRTIKRTLMLLLNEGSASYTKPGIKFATNIQLVM